MATNFLGAALKLIDSTTTYDSADINESPMLSGAKCEEDVVVIVT